MGRDFGTRVAARGQTRWGRRYSTDEFGYEMGCMG